MTTTVRNLVTGAMRLINVIKQGETPSPDDLSISLSAFDAMIDSWANDRLMVYKISQALVTTVGGQSTYTMGPCQNILTFNGLVSGSGYTNGTYVQVPVSTVTGTGQFALANITIAGGIVTAISISQDLSGPGDESSGGGWGYLPGDKITVSNQYLGGFGSGFSALVATTTGGDWAMERPLRIEQCYVVWNGNMSPQGVDLGVSVLNDAQFASIAVKNTPSSFPFALYDDGGYPNKSIQLWPVPTGSVQLRLWLREPLVDFTNIDTIISYPPGYERAFRFSLAAELAAEFGKDIPNQVASTANSAKQEIATMNAVPQYLTGDGGLSKSRQAFNWITGGMVPWTRF